MKTRYITAIAMLALIGFAQPSTARFEPVYELGPVEPGEMRVQQSVGIANADLSVRVAYDFVFKLAEGSDGIYPAAEVVEIEVPGELSPDGSQSPAFVISIPVGSFHEGPAGFFYAWNPPGLKVSQHNKSDVWDFVGSDGVRKDSEGVWMFLAFIRVRDADQQVNVVIRMRMTDNRIHDGTIGPAPKIFELLTGSPTLSIGNDEWKTQLRGGRLFSRKCMPANEPCRHGIGGF